MTVLSVSSGLLFIFVFHIRFLLDGFSESHLRFAQFNLYFILIQQLAGDHLQMQISHSIEKHLSVLGVIDIFHSQIFMGYFLQSLRNLIHIALILRFISHICIRLRHFPFTIFNGCCLGRQAIAGSCRRQFCKRTKISCMKFFYLDCLATLHYVKLTDLFFNILIHVIDQIVCFKNTGIYLNQGIFANKRIHDGLPDISRFSL